MNKWKKWLDLAVVAVLVILLCVYNIPIPIARTVTATECRLNALTSIETRTITLEGHYHINLFTADTFSGSLQVSGYDAPSGSFAVTSVDAGTSKGSLIRYTVPDFKEYVFGTLYADFFMSNMLITVYEMQSGTQVFSPTDGIVIAEGNLTSEELVEFFRNVTPWDLEPDY